MSFLGRERERGLYNNISISISSRGISDKRATYYSHSYKSWSVDLADRSDQSLSISRYCIQLSHFWSRYYYIYFKNKNQIYSNI